MIPTSKQKEVQEEVPVFSSVALAAAAVDFMEEGAKVMG
jgi:hypothetical protein